MSVAGHSVGEWAAACLAGVFTLKDALRSIALRGRLMQSPPPEAAWRRSARAQQAALGILNGRSSRVAIAALNGPAQIVLRGRFDELVALEPHFRDAGIRWQSTSSRTPSIRRWSSRCSTSSSAPWPRRNDLISSLRLISNLTGKLVDAALVRTPAYWKRHVREAVRFADTLATLGELRIDAMVEIGPHPTLLSFAGSVFGDAGPARVPSLRKGADDRTQMLDALATLYLAGVRINWKAVDDGAARIVDLPSYPSAPALLVRRASGFAGWRRCRQSGAHPLLGAPTALRRIRSHS